MSRLLGCLTLCGPRVDHADCADRADSPPGMGAALSQLQEGEACDGAGPPAPPTMADVIRERKKKAGGAGLGTLRRRLAAAARRPRDQRPDRGCEHARHIRSVVSSWRLAEVWLLGEQLEAGAVLRDLATRADLAREPAPTLHADLSAALCAPPAPPDVTLVGAGWALPAHRAVLAARSDSFRDLLRAHPKTQRVPVDRAMSRADGEALLRALYGGTHAHGCDKPESGGGCLCALPPAATLAHDLRYLLDTGEHADARLVWAGGGGARALELPAHKVILCARSRFFRNVLTRRSGVVCLDEAVVPRRFGRALLNAAYTDLVDLALLPQPAPHNNAVWAGRGGGRGGTHLEDAFQLYEIARFLEMPIVVQGCEDAVVEALSPETLPAVLRWAAAPHASHWVQRQAMRYLRDEFPLIMSAAAAARLPRAALSEALGSGRLQASEGQALRALLRWGERQAGPREASTAASVVGGGGRRRRSLQEAAVRAALGPLLPLIRAEHLPRDHDLLQQCIRRGLMPPPLQPEDGCGADAWLGRPPYRPARCFMPYLDEIKALLAGQPPPSAELARLRRQRLQQRIPDTLYMVAAASPRADQSAQGSKSQDGQSHDKAQALGVEGTVLRALRARTRRLAAAGPRPCQYTKQHREQIALRAVREMSLPDACAELLLTDTEDGDDHSVAEGSSDAGWAAGAWPDADLTADCCRTLSSGGSGRCGSAGSLHTHDESSRNLRRELPTRPDSSFRPWRLSAAVPDVAMAPNANTHLLTPHYSHATTHSTTGHTVNSGGSGLVAQGFGCEYNPGVSPSGGVRGTRGGRAVLQLDLGDGATHTPRPGSRAGRAGAARARRDLQCAGAGRRDDELRTALDLTQGRAYSALQPTTASNNVSGTANSLSNIAACLGSNNSRDIANYNRDILSLSSSLASSGRDLAVLGRDLVNSRELLHLTNNLSSSGRDLSARDVSSREIANLSISMGSGRDREHTGGMASHGGNNTRELRDISNHSSAMANHSGNSRELRDMANTARDLRDMTNHSSAVSSHSGTMSSHSGNMSNNTRELRDMSNHSGTMSNNTRELRDMSNHSGTMSNNTRELRDMSNHSGTMSNNTRDLRDMSNHSGTMSNNTRELRDMSNHSGTMSNNTRDLRDMSNHSSAVSNHSGTMSSHSGTMSNNTRELREIPNLNTPITNARDREVNFSTLSTHRELSLANTRELSNLVNRDGNFSGMTNRDGRDMAGRWRGHSTLPHWPRTHSAHGQHIGRPRARSPALPRPLHTHANRADRSVSPPAPSPPALYRLDSGYGGASRGHSPNSYA